jgi:dolichyl-diphosphooligosaccharide--protein glycosyltransferase
MSSTGAPSVLKDESTRNIRQLLKVVILFTIAGAAVSSRLFSVIRKLSPRF